MGTWRVNHYAIAFQVSPRIPKVPFPSNHFHDPIPGPCAAKSACHGNLYQEGTVGSWWHCVEARAAISPYLYREFAEFLITNERIHSGAREGCPLCLYGTAAQIFAPLKDADCMQRRLVQLRMTAFKSDVEMMCQGSRKRSHPS